MSYVRNRIWITVAAAALAVALMATESRGQSNVTIPGQTLNTSPVTVTVPKDPAITTLQADVVDLKARVAALEGAASAPPTPTPPSGAASATFTTTTAELANPDRGFYGWSGSDFATSYDAASVTSAYNSGQRLVLAKVSLASYRSSDLPASFLNTLSARFSSIRAAGMKVSLWFAYDWTSGGNDATASWIARHLEQLKPVLAANADVIPVMRAGFIGAWGEWHSSKAGNSCGYNSGSTTCATADANRLAVRNALLANVPSTTQIGFRYPADLMKWWPNAANAQAGSHNDCFLAGPGDSGTYSSSAQRSYVQSLTDRQTFGGETCNNAETPLRTSCSAILEEGPAYHLAWLNASYAMDFINAWNSGGCMAQVKRSMGYRLQLDAITHTSTVARGESVVAQIDLRNVGWARLPTARKLAVTLRHKSTGGTITAVAGNLRDLVSQASASSRITVSVPIPSGATVGDYDVLLAAPDVHSSLTAAKWNARFANADNGSQAWDSAAGAFKVGTTVTVE